MTTSYNPVVASTVVGIQGPVGSGAPGSKEYTGAGVPASGLGTNGDHYINTATGDYYEKQAGAWVLLFNLTGPAGTQGAAGSVLRNGGVAPSNGTGVDGDYYLNSVNGNLYQRVTGAYTLVANLTGPQGTAGGAGVAGATGAPGAVWRNGTGAPSSSLGVNGDMYLDTAAYNLYQKASGSYAIVANIKGATGAAGSNVAALSPATAPFTIQGLGDSITAQTIYFPTSFNLATLPAWQASTAYVAGNHVVNNGLLYYATAGGASAASGGPTGNGGTDGTVNWAILKQQQAKSGTSYLTWAEIFSEGKLRWRQSTGYGGVQFGLVKIIIVSGGANYSAGTTVACGNGSILTTTVVAGAITAVTVVDPGYATSFAGYTITDPSGTGSGAVLSLVADPSGTFGVPGCLTSDMVARLPDVVAAKPDYCVVHGGTNDNANPAIAYATTIANLRTCYETLAAAGITPVVVPILPRTSGNTAIVAAARMRVNRWIRAYANLDIFANPLGIRVLLADPTPYFADGTSDLDAVIGGTGGAGAMTQEGLHPSHRGAMYFGYAVWEALQSRIGTFRSATARGYTSADGYNRLTFPSGNLLEAQPWTASTAFALNDLVKNSGNIYYCSQAGTTATSGGPTGTSTVTDGTAKWTYARPARMSVFGSGASGTISASGTITPTGSLASGFGFSYNFGTSAASGSIALSIESPRSDGYTGQRQVITYSLSGGSATETWKLETISKPYAYYGIAASDLGVTQYVAECELEISNVANMSGLVLQVGGDYFTAAVGPSATGIAYHLMSSAGEMIPIPTNGRFYMRTDEFTILPNTVNLDISLLMSLDASAGQTATATVKINNLGLRKFGVA